MPLHTCKHLYDTGGTCNSATAHGRDYCVYHLRHRARLVRIAKYRARNERFDVNLPPLENMYAGQSALNQLAEAVAAGLLDLKRARYLLSVVRAAIQFLMHPDKWQANLYHTDQSGSAVDLAAEYGLPQDLDTPPEVAFPPPAEGAPPAGAPDEGRLCTRQGGLSPVFGDSVGNAAAASDESNDPYVSALRTDGILGDIDFRPDFPITPDYVESDEVRRTQGDDASLARSTQMLRNQRRRRFRSERKRYAAIAARINLYRAAEKLAQRKLAENEAQAKLDARRPPASVSASTGETVSISMEATTA